MMDPERDRIRAEAKAEADNANWKKSVDDHIKEMQTIKSHGIKAMIGAVAYLAWKVWVFVSGGGQIRW